MRLKQEISRQLLRHLRTVMADKKRGQERLNHIVALIAVNMGVAVCSLYLHHKHDMLELYATRGLKEEAVHKTILSVGEGLVGDIAQHARLLNVSEVHSHPLFVYRPETQEDRLKSFLGVPLLRSGRVIGVLVVQDIVPHHFTEEEVETLETVAMVLSEMTEILEAINMPLNRNQENQKFEGIVLNQGVAIGHIVLHEPRVELHQLVADDVEEEYARLDEAVYKLRQNVDALLMTEDVSHAGDHLDVLETYKMFANDRGWLARMRESIATGLTAEAAVENVQNNIQARLMRQRDMYLRERLHDFEDLSNRLLRVLTGQPLSSSACHLPENAILVARGMGPAELLDYDSKRIHALVLEEGTTSAHVTIVAKALRIPMIGRLNNIVDVARDGQKIIVDAEFGHCYLNPSSVVIERYEERQSLLTRRYKEFDRVKKLPAMTQDGVSIDVSINAGLMVDVNNLVDSGAGGIGLFRTELKFMISSQLPKIKEQIAFYRHVLEVAGEMPVVFRTLDIGGDKVLPYMRREPEENPSMGWRAIRVTLDRPSLLRYQLRALLQATAGRKIRIIFPMISVVDEFVQARALLNKELARLRKLGYSTPVGVQLGAMIEVPSLIWQLDRLLAQVDFVCIGTNDLMQFFFASDRGNPRISDRYDVLSDAPLKMLKQIADCCILHDKPVTICGEIAGQPLEAMVLLGLGFTHLSMPSVSVGAIKQMIRSLPLEQLQTILQTTTMERETLKRLAHKLNVII